MANIMFGNYSKSGPPQSTIAYDLNNEDLLDRFVNACVKAGISCSGLVIDPCADYDHMNAKYLRGVVLARLEGQKPPLASGTKVIVPEGRKVTGILYNQEILFPGTIFTVERVFFFGKGNWCVELRKKQDLFPLSQLIPIKEEEKSSP